MHHWNKKNEVGLSGIFLPIHCRLFLVYLFELLVNIYRHNKCYIEYIVAYIDGLFISVMDLTANCINCHISFKKVSGQTKTINSDLEIEAILEQLGLNVVIGQKLCDKCRRLVFFGTSKKKYESEVQPSTSTQDNVSEQSSESFSLTPSTNESQSSNPSLYEVIERKKVEEPKVILPLKRSITSHKFCIVCKATKNLTTVPIEARLQCFNKCQIFIPSGSRTCSNHLLLKRFYEEDLNAIQVYSHSSSLTISEIALFLTKTSEQSPISLFDKIKSGDLTKKQLYSFTGLSYAQLKELSDMLTSMRKSDSRDVVQALVIFLFKLRTGESNNIISSIFQIKREQQVSEMCDSIINSFVKDVLPNNFGVNSYTREYLIQNHTSFYAKKLFNIGPDKLALVYDGTYIRHQKSKNNEYQRKSYSGHKKLPLCKPFTICTTDGFVVDVPGPYLATENDACIMKKVIMDENGIGKIMKEGDVCIVDRGFRDVVPFLEEKGFVVLMPALKGKRSNLTCKEANDSRFVTKLRWVVEAVHGILGKKYRLLHHQLDNKLLPKVGEYCKIACFLNNRFGKRLNCDGELEDAILKRMLNSRVDENSLAIEVENARWSRRPSLAQKLTSEDLSDFPEMTERDLKIFFSGKDFFKIPFFLKRTFSESGYSVFNYLLRIYQQSFLIFQVHTSWVRLFLT